MTRAEAIEILNNKGFTFCNFERCVDFYTALNCEKCEEALTMAIQELKSTQVEKACKLRKADSSTGKWVHQDHNKRHGMRTTCVCYMPTCSECGKAGDEQYRYCPNCGSRMEVEEIDDRENL